jgi:hypothetical protein
MRSGITLNFGEVMRDGIKTRRIRLMIEIELIMIIFFMVGFIGGSFKKIKYE